MIVRIPFFLTLTIHRGGPIVSEIRNPRTHESECERGDLLSSLQVHAILDGRSTCISCDSVGQCINSLVVESGAFDMYEYRRRVVGDGEEQTPHIRPFTSISFHAQEFEKKKNHVTSCTLMQIHTTHTSLACKSIAYETTRISQKKTCMLCKSRQRQDLNLRAHRAVDTIFMELYFLMSNHTKFKSTSLTTRTHCRFRKFLSF